MAEQARVESIEALKRFRETLARFGEDAQHALEAVDIELRRAKDWLEQEQPRYWKHQIKVWNQRMAEARSALHRKNLQRTDGFIPDVSQEKEALRVSKQRIEEAERQLMKIKRWVPQFEHAVAEYRGRAQPLYDAAGIDIGQMLALIDRMIEALEAYVSTPPPRRSTDQPPQTNAEPNIRSTHENS